MLGGSGKQNSLFPLGPVIKCLLNAKINSQLASNHVLIVSIFFKTCIDSKRVVS